MAFCTKYKRSYSVSSLTESVPPKQSLCPPKNLVPECITISMPASSGVISVGVPNVLSTAVIIWCRLPKRAIAARSGTDKRGLPIVSAQINRVLSSMADSMASASVISTKVTSISDRLQILWNNRYAPPYKSQPAMIRSPEDNNMVTAWIAAMPVENASDPRPFSIAVSVDSKFLRDGLPERL